ncbi:MAG: hypothetical protein GY929_23185 [Actinomycetia bacterium]|nr:hypothetical protein [Actinomycetes bacterium]
MILVGVAGVAAARPLSDNSFLTHLATGRLILDTGELPSVDPYTFTGGGEPWIAQSWLASVVYGVVELVGGGLGLRLLHGGLIVSLAVLVWWLTSRAPAPTTRLVVAAPVVLLGLTRWTERPLLAGLIGLALVLAALQGRIDPRLLVPVLWVWVNSHGSFPLAVALLGAAVVGQLLDREPVAATLRVAGWAGLGILLGGLNPYGTRLWTFPVELMARSGLLRDMVREWQPIGLDQPSALIFVVMVLLAVIGVSRDRRWAEVLPAIGFTIGAILSVRNTGPATLVLIPVLARGLAGEEIGRLPQLSAPTARRASVAVGAGLAAIAALMMMVTPTWDWDGYPVTSLAVADARGLTGPDVRLVARDYVGNARTFREGAHRSVFIDDRYEMHSDQLILDQVELMAGTGWERILDRYEADAVLWETETPLGEALAASSDWVSIETEPGWLLACRRGSRIEGSCR